MRRSSRAEHQPIIINRRMITMSQSPADRRVRRNIVKLSKEQQEDLASENRPARVKQVRRPIDDTDIIPSPYRSPRARRIAMPGVTHD